MHTHTYIHTYIHVFLSLYLCVVVCMCLCIWLYVSVPSFPFPPPSSFLSACSDSEDNDKREEILVQVLLGMPKVNLKILAYLCQHLNR